MDLASPHAIADHIPSYPVDDDLPVVHGVADPVLAVAKYPNGGALHECGQVLPGSPVDLDGYGAFQPITDIPLAIDVK